MPTAYANSVLDAIVADILTIDAVAQPLVYITTPSAGTVRRELKVAAVTGAPRPFVAVELLGYRSSWMGGGLHDVELTVGCHILVSGDPNNPEAQLISIARDIEKKLRTDESLGGLVNAVGQTFEFQPDTEVAVGAGEAFATLSFPVRGRTDHSTV